MFATALPRSLSLFNDREATPATIEKSGYTFQLTFVGSSSPEIERTPVGKVPLVRDREVTPEPPFTT
jgi:phenylacetate-CoA ligase